MDPVRLPEQFVKKPLVLLDDLQPGESGWVEFSAMAIDAEHRCYIDPTAKTGERSGVTIRVTRTDAGFEVWIPAISELCGRRPGGSRRAYEGWIGTPARVR